MEGGGEQGWAWSLRCKCNFEATAQPLATAKEAQYNPPNISAIIWSIAFSRTNVYLIINPRVKQSFFTVSRLGI